MATWKKVIVSGSNADLNKLNVNNNQQISSSVAGTFLSGSFSGSFAGSLQSELSNNIQANIVGYNTATGLFSYQGTGSFTSTTASYVTSSGVYGPYGSNSILSASYAESASHALNTNTASVAINSQTASYVNTLNQNVIVSGALYVNNGNGISQPDIYTNFIRDNYQHNNSIYLNDTTKPSGHDLTISALYFPSDINLEASFGNINIRPTSTSGSVVITGSLIVTNGITGSLSGSASYAENAGTASYVTGSDVYGPYGSNSILSSSYASSSLSSSYAETATTSDTASFIAGAISNNTNNYILTATGGGVINGESNLTFDGSTLTISGNTTVTGDLTVAGTASFNNQTSLLIADRFILLASGSNTLTDGGIIIASGGLSGSAFFLESTSTGTAGRFAVASDIHTSASSVDADEYAVTAKINQASNPASAPTYGGSGNGSGNIWVTNAGDIWIYA